jgi:hypothetical protein
MTDVPVDRLLLGAQNGMSASDFAAALGDPLWASRRVAEGPHAELLALGREGELSDAAVLASSYGRMARVCIEQTGRYFATTDPDDAEGIADGARRFVRRATGRAPDPSPEPATHDHRSPEGQPVLAVPIADSDCLQVLDGHHRVAAAGARGPEMLPVRVRRGSVSTPLQELLRSMSWLGGTMELYQPLHFPELETWPTVRRCTDRLESMRRFLATSRIGLAGTGYLDVASCYGWFVSQMAELGLDAAGIERDPLAPELGRLVYGLDPSRITVGDAVPLLRDTSRRWDVVSCFSLLHHFVLGRGECSAPELVRLLDRVTGRVLFLDTGQENERWFRSSLRGWNPSYIHDFLATHTTFDEIVDLGPDLDAVPPYEQNYGRHLFACVRNRP